MNPHIVIAGGGFAGTTLVRTLQRRLPREAALTLISEESYTTFNPLLPEAVGAALFPEQTVAPIRAMLAARTRFGLLLDMGFLKGAKRAGPLRGQGHAHRAERTRRVRGP